MKKFIPIILILIILAGGMFGEPSIAEAEDGNCAVSGAIQRSKTDTECAGLGGTFDPYGSCSVPSMVGMAGQSVQQNKTQAECTAIGATTTWTRYVVGAPSQTTNNPNYTSGDSYFYSQLGCSFGNIFGCFVKILYGFFVGVLTFLLWIATKFFDFMAFMTLSSDMYALGFINDIWKIIRDFSNLFFILILLYAAMQLILGIGHDARRIVVWVIMMAILINFSLFFTRVVVDSSNILGLVFYNRIDTSGVKNESIGGAATGGEKNLAAALARSFSINSFFSETTINSIVASTPKKTLDNFTAASLILVYAIVVGPLVYAFFVAGFAFLARMVTLMILMMASPFAFMSYAFPPLQSMEMVGFKNWWHKLISSAFAAAIFMFILYIISVFLKADIFKGIDRGQGTAATLISIFIPGVVIVMLLLAGLKFTKKAASDFTDKVMGAGKTLAGFGLGVATGGAAFALTQTVGRRAASVAKDDTLKARAAAGDKGAQRRLDQANYLATKSFDIRQTKLGKLAAKKSGVDLNAGASWVGLDDKVTKGGFKKRQEEEQDRHDKKLASYEMSGLAAQKQDEKAARDPQNARHKKYQADLEEARKFNAANGRELDETVFKRMWMADNGSGSVERGEKTSAEINKERREAYALSLEDPGKKLKDVGIIRSSFNSFRAGMINAVTTKTGAAAVVTGAALAGPVGAAVAVPIYGLVAAIKDLAKAGTQSGLYRVPAIPVVGKIFGPNEELVHNIRTGASRGQRKAREKHHESEELKELIEELAHEKHGKKKKPKKDEEEDGHDEEHH